MRALPWLLLLLHSALSYKTLQQFDAQRRAGPSATAADQLLGRAVDFVYSNQTLMGLVARGLWDVGAGAIDRIVEIRGKPLDLNKRKHAKKK